MKLPVEWLREYLKTPVSDEDLADRLTMVGLEVEEITGEGDERVFHTKITANRGDWASIIGVAREAAAALDLPLGWNPSLKPADIGGVNEWASVLVTDSTLCPRYGGAVIRNVTMGPSPDWMQRRLTAAGMRPINNVVDITNYVLLEMGQPLHAFDLDEIPEGKIIVRPANAGEGILTLDGVERALEPGMLMICDRDHPVCIAGVMGNAETEVSAETRHVFLESAHFDAGSIRRTSKAVGLSTEASYRFERTVDPALVPLALECACALLAEIAGGEVVPGRIDIYPNTIAPRTITLRPARVNAILGTDLDDVTIVQSLKRLELAADSTTQPYRVTVPTFRTDLVQEIDLIEEVGRMVGYETLPETMPPARGIGGGDAPPGAFAQRLRALLSGMGLQEALTHSLAAPSDFDNPEDQACRVTIRQALSAELSGLRQSLIPNLLVVLAHNLRQRQPDVRLFEVGKVFNRSSGSGGYGESRSVAAALTGAAEPKSWRAERAPEIDFFVVKGLVETLLATLHIVADFAPAQRHGMHPGRCAEILVNGREIGIIAEVDPDLARTSLEVPNSTGRIAVFELNADALLSFVLAENLRYGLLPRYPALNRDLAVLVDTSVPYADIERTARAAADPNLLADLTLQSVYTGERVPEGTKSVALRFTFRSLEKTLTDAEVNAQLSAIESALAAGVGARQR